MSVAAQSVLKPIPMATCLISVPSLFTPSNSHTHLAICFKPTTKLQLCCSYSPLSAASLFSRKKKETVFRASTISAQQEEEDFNWGEAANEDEGGDNEGYAEPPEEAKLYVGNLSYDVENEQLAGLFGEAGVVEIVEVICNRETGQSRGFGFVTMSTVEEAEKAVDMFHRYELNGRMLTVNKAAPKGSRPERTPRVFEGSSRIYVGNLPWTVDDERLEQLFSEHGKVVSARVVSDRETGRSRGFGFVVMSDESEMNDAIANLDGQNVDGRALRVNVAEEKPRARRF